MLFPYSDHCRCKRTDDSEKHAQSRQYHSAEEPTAVIRRRIGGIHLSFCACLENRPIVRIFGHSLLQNGRPASENIGSLHPSLPFPAFPKNDLFAVRIHASWKLRSVLVKESDQIFRLSESGLCRHIALRHFKLKASVLLRQNGDFAESGL